MKRAAARLCRRLICTFACAGCALTCFAADHSPAPVPDDGPNAHQHAGLEFFRDLEDGNYQAAEIRMTGYVKGRARFVDGEWKSAEVLQMYGKVLGAFHEWNRYREPVDAWRAAMPRSASAAITEAAYWVSYGFWTRGGDASGRIPPRAMALALERVENGRAVLAESSAFSRASPEWYGLMIQAAMIAGEPPEQSRRLFDQGSAAFPAYYGTYDAMAQALLPQWGGDRARFDAFADLAVTRTRATVGQAMYARLYRLLARSDETRDPFTGLLIPWPKMRAGFDDLLKHFPASQWNLQAYAYYACRADDGVTYLRLLPRLDGNWMSDEHELWHGSFTMTFCSERYARRT